MRILLRGMRTLDPQAMQAAKQGESRQALANTRWPPAPLPRVTCLTAHVERPATLEHRQGYRLLPQPGPSRAAPGSPIAGLKAPVVAPVAGVPAAAGVAAVPVGVAAVRAQPL